MDAHIHCHDCGRDLAAGSGACPRCNAAVPPSALRFPTPARTQESDPRVTKPAPGRPESDPRRSHGGSNTPA